MKTKSSIARAAVACVIAATTVAALAPAAASAQSYYGGGYGSYGSAYDSRGYNYDPCARDTSKRATTGGLIGLAAGAAIGSNMAGRHNRNEGTALGGVVGALVGSQIGKSSAACAPEPRGYSGGSYYDSYAYAQPTYVAPPPPPPPPSRGYYDRYSYSDRYNSNSGYGYADGGCQMVESRVRMPDGRTQTRMVQTCPDSRGNYQIVN